MPVEGFESVTTVPGITASVESVTTPVIEELSCACAKSAIEITQANNADLESRFRISFQSPQ
jgi:hypothetical protein